MTPHLVQRPAAKRLVVKRPVVKRLAAVVAALALALVGVAVTALPASAHNRVIASTPAPGSTLTALPARFTITTDLPLLVIGGSTRGFGFDIADAHGRHYGDGCITVVDNAMSTPAALGAPGAYTVRYQFVSADGHTVSDTYGFTWAPSGAFTPDRSHATAQRCGGPAATGETAAPSAGGSGRGASVPLGDVVWIGGAILVVLVAGGVLLILLTRRPRAAGGPDAGGPPAGGPDAGGRAAEGPDAGGRGSGDGGGSGGAGPGST